jgi:hypothetical protein
MSDPTTPPPALNFEAIENTPTSVLWECFRTCGEAFDAQTISSPEGQDMRRILEVFEKRSKLGDAGAAHILAGLAEIGKTRDAGFDALSARVKGAKS